MLLSATIIAVVVISLVEFYNIFKQQPPGPWGLPLLGYYPFIGSNPPAKFAQLADTYGDILTVNILGSNYYYFNGLEVIKEVFVKQANITSDRPVHFGNHSPLGLVLGKRSLLTSSGNDWKIQHKFNLSKLTELGMGKDELSHKISQLFENVVEYLQKRNRQASDVYEILTNFTSNVISMIVFSKSYAHDDPVYIRLRDFVNEFFMCCPGIDANLSGFLFHLCYRAVIQEIQRYVCIFPFAIARSNSKKLKIGDYLIPEKSNLILNVWKLSRDKKEFKNPDNFDPNNFLNENREFVKNEANLPFSAGKRICIGANLASMELFIGFVTLMQMFKWKSPQGETVKREIIGSHGQVLRNFKCIAISRH